MEELDQEKRRWGVIVLQGFTVNRRWWSKKYLPCYINIFSTYSWTLVKKKSFFFSSQSILCHSYTTLQHIFFFFLSKKHTDACVSISPSSSPALILKQFLSPLYKVNLYLMRHQYWSNSSGVFCLVWTGVVVMRTIWQVLSYHLRVASDIVHINAQQVAQSVGHEDRTEVNLHHVVYAALHNADLQQLLQVNAVSQAVHVSPLHTFSKNRDVTTNRREFCLNFLKRWIYEMNPGGFFG